MRASAMTRRSFLAAAACSAGRAGAAPPAIDLRVPLARAVSCMTNRMDPAQNYRPWFAIDVKNHRPVRLRHDRWDCGDTGGRFVEAYVLARRIAGADATTREAERHARGYFASLFAGDGLVYNPDLKGPDHSFAQGSALYALVVDFEDSRSAETKTRIERLISALDRKAVHERDYLWFPEVATKIAPCSHMSAYQVLPIVRFYELTGHAPALRYASQLSRWALYHDPTITSAGVITKTGWEGHLHAWMDTFSGILRCSKAPGSGLDHAEVRDRSVRLFEWVRANYTSPFGWVADSVGSKTCETDTITSAIRLALELIAEGRTEYWNDIERFVRNQLIENQFVGTRGLQIRDPQLARGLEGCFESYADPNTLLAVESGDLEGCCINGGIRGLDLAWRNAVVDTPEEVRVNLLITVEHPALDVVSRLPYEGRIQLNPKSTKPVRLRLPDWLSADAVHVEGPAGMKDRGERGALHLSGVKPGSAIVVRFTQRETTRTHVVAGRSYKARWRGDTVIDLQPAGSPYPTYQNRAT